MKIALLTTDNREQDRDYAAPEPCFGTAPEALLRGFAHLPEVEAHVISCVRQPVISPENLAPNVFYHSLVVPKLGWMRTAYAGCIRATRKKLREIRPDIVHGQGTERDCAISAVFSGFPNVLTIHGNMRSVAKANAAPPLSFLWCAARLEAFVLPRTHGIVCITNYTRRLVEPFAVKTWVAPNAVDEGFFEINARPAGHGTPALLCVGNVLRHKNQNTLIRALDSLAEQRPFHLVFLGQAEKSHPYGSEFFQLLESRPWCRYEGFATRSQLKQHFQTASALVLPTLEDNCPMVVLEAMAAGVPVLASSIGGVPDLIEPEKTGLFCDPQNPDSFREGVTRLLDDRDFAGRLAANAKTEAQRRFHPQAIARRHLEIYREVLKGKSK
jgi:glycosyltransferase involved in cell wall biosynthesis